MGLSASWIAVRGLDRGEIAARLECIDTDAVPDRRTELALGRTASDWWIVECGRFDFPTPDRLSALSQQAEVIAWQVDEHVMVSAAYAFRDGVQVWSVTHDPAKGIYDLAVDGAPPPELDPIRVRLVAEQDAEGGEDGEVDFLFDAAAEVSAALTGYRLEGDEAISFTQLRPKRQGLLQVLFGRR